jgi:hypothetical protein
MCVILMATIKTSDFTDVNDFKVKTIDKTCNIKIKFD